MKNKPKVNNLRSCNLFKIKDANIFIAYNNYIGNYRIFDTIKAYENGKVSLLNIFITQEDMRHAYEHGIDVIKS